MISLCSQAFELIDLAEMRTKSFYISTDDVACNLPGKVTLGFTQSDGVVVCPDYTFDKWVECGIDDFENTIARILKRSEGEPVSNKLFWIGNPRTQELRFKLLCLGSAHADRLSIVPMNWLRDYPKGHMHRFTHYVSLEDHTDYRYLIDCGAAGFSGRLKFLLHSNRALFLVDRDPNKKEYYYDQLIAYEHFIPVSTHLDDLIDKLDWAYSHPAEVDRIAASARQFAIQFLGRKTAVEYLAKAIVENV